MTNYTNDIAKIKRRADTAYHEQKKDWTPRKAMKARAMYKLLASLRKVQAERMTDAQSNDR